MNIRPLEGVTDSQLCDTYTAVVRACRSCTSAAVAVHFEAIGVEMLKEFASRRASAPSVPDHVTPRARESRWTRLRALWAA